MKSLFVGILLLVGSCAAYQLIVPLTAPENLIEGEYIVSFHQNASVPQQRAAIDLIKKLAPEGTVNFYSIGTFSAVSAPLKQEDLIVLQKVAVIDYIEQQELFHINACQKQSSNAPWGLARISQNTFTSAVSNQYIYDADGTGTTCYVVDTGIRITHNEFQTNGASRARWGIDTTSEKNQQDGNGHGTHVAGTVAGNTYGVAKKSKLVAVKVLSSGGSGTTAGVIAGVDWSVSDCKATTSTNKCVINMSLGGGASTSMNAAVDAAVAAGVFVVVAAGNENSDACLSSPASAASVLTVGATNEPVSPSYADKRASYSNFGSCVNIFAPGTAVLSSWYTSDSATNTISGTSMASPHTAGQACAVRSTGNLDTSATRSKILALARTVSGIANCDSLLSGSKAVECAKSPNTLLGNSCA